MRAVAHAVLLALVLAGCSGHEEVAAPTETAAISDALLSATWPVRMADAATRAPFESHPGWGALFRREHTEALAAFTADPGDGRGLARIHLEMSIIYREATRLAANATLQVYDADHSAEDPVEVAYLVGVSRALLGQTDGAKTAFAALPAGTAVAKQAAAWKAWLDAGAVWPPDATISDPAAGFPGVLPEVVAGQTPGIGALPHYRFIERDPEKLEVAATDPTPLYLLARWHEAAARKAAPQDDAVISQLIGVWRLPPEAAPSADLLPVADAWLFGGFLMAPEDAAFLAAACSGGGIGAVSTWADRSPLAAAVAPSIKDGKLDPERMLDQAAWLGDQVEAAMAVKGGQVEVFHRSFADLARAAALRAGMVVADAAGETRDAGILRINALDRSVGVAADPVFFTSVAAWDVGNRNPLRAQELVYGLLSRFPPVEASRYPLDAMHIRLGRNAAPATPVF